MLDESSAEAARRLAEEGAELAREAGFRARGLAVPSEHGAWRTLLRIASELDAATIVTGTHGHAAMDAVIGSVAEGVVRHAERPVLVVPATGADVGRPCPSPRTPARCVGGARQVSPFSPRQVRPLLYGLLPRLAGVHDGWDRIDSADPCWLLGALILELPVHVGYVMLFGLVLAGRRIDATTAWLTTIAGVAATRLIAAGGAGGIALTAWVLRRAGEDARAVAAGLTAFLVLLYSVYTAALVVGGVGLLTGLWPGPAPVAPCVLAVAVGGGIIVLWAGLGLAAIGALVRSDATDGWRGALGAIPSGIRDAIAVARRRDRRLLGAPAWWGFDIATLAACLAAFGEPPAPAALVVAYFVGMLGNLLPLPAASAASTEA